MQFTNRHSIKKIAVFFYQNRGFEKQLVLCFTANFSLNTKQLHLFTLNASQSPEIQLKGRLMNRNWNKSAQTTKNEN